MVNKIVENIKRLFGNFDNVISRKDLKDSANNSLEILATSLSSQIDDIKVIVKTIDMKIDDSPAVKEVVRLAKIKAKNMDEFLTYIKSVNNDILNHSDDIIEKIDSLPASMVEDSITAKQLAILRLVNNLEGYVEYLGDLLYMIHNDATGAGDEIIAKNIKKRLENRKVFFYIALKEFTIINEVIDNIDKLSNEPINFKSESGISYLSAAKDGVVSGFAGNPIYFIGKVIEDMKLARAERLEERAKIYRLTIAKLKAEKEAGETPPNYERQLEYYNNKLRKLESKIEKLRS